jgi:hypothetical protein
MIRIRSKPDRLTVKEGSREEGASREDVEQKLNDAGFDSGPIAHLL